MVWVGPLLAYWASRANGTGLIGCVEWSSPKHDGVKLLEWSPKMELSLWSRTIFLKMELSQTNPNCSTVSQHDRIYKHRCKIDCRPDPLPGRLVNPIPICLFGTLKQAVVAAAAATSTTSRKSIKEERKRLTIPIFFKFKSGSFSGGLNFSHVT